MKSRVICIRDLKHLDRILKHIDLSKVTLMSAAPTLAVSSGDIQSKVSRGFDPIIGLLQALAMPAGIAMMITGGIIVMTGNKKRGLDVIKWAGIGYVVIQFAPSLMKILGDVGRSISAG